MLLSWPWHFVSLSPAEIQLRRELLDLHGYYAQCSVLLAIIAIRTYNSHGRAAKDVESSNEKQSQPRPKSWWDSPLSTGWTETKRQYIISFIWLGWLLYLSVWKSGDDYLHLTKALGHVALSQLPFQVLMSPALYISTTQPASASIISVLTSISQPALTPYHRLFGRVVILPLLIGHATLYLSFFVQSNHGDFSSLLAKRILDPDVQWGIGGVITTITILLFARPAGPPLWVSLWKINSVRARRQVFYVVHVLLVAALCLVAYNHVAYAQVYVLQTLGGFVVNLGCCWILK